MNDVESGSAAASNVAIGATAALRSVGRGFIEATLNTTPNQVRSQNTLARILIAGRTVGMSKGKAGLTMSAIAERASVSLATVYRYFSSPDDLIRMLVREQQMHKFNIFRNDLQSMKFASVEELVTVIAARITCNYMVDNGVSHTIGLMLLRNYHRIAYDELWDLAGAVVNEVHRRGLAELADDAQSRLAMALAAAGAAAKMAALRSPEHLREARFTHSLTDVLLGALRSDARTLDKPSFSPRNDNF